jgi:hypothetical protein
VTVQPTGAPGAVEQWSDTGLEDFGVADAVLPRIKIEQKEALWSENLGNQKFEVLRFIPLGLVKQRVLFHHNVEDNDVPMCKSSDFELGYPNPNAPAQKSFPWQLAGFDPNDFPPDANGDRRLPCANCHLKDWGTSPINEQPYCSEQWTLPIYFDVEMNNSWQPAILTLQKSSIKPIRSYFTPYSSSNQPPFIHIAQGTLKMNHRGQVDYSVPTFIKEGDSPRDRWQEFNEQFKEMRTFLRRPPVRDTDAQPELSANVNVAPAVAQPAQPVQQTASEDPWATTAQPADLPAAQPQQAPVAVHQHVQQQPVQQAAPPVQQSAPPTPAAAPEAPAQPAAPPAAAPSPAGDDLPF